MRARYLEGKRYINSREMFYRKIAERGQMALRVWRDKKKYLDGRKPVRGGMALKGETGEEERKSQKVW